MQFGDELVHGQLRGLFKLAHQGQAVAGSHHHFKSPCLTMAKGVFAHVVNVKTVMRMLDHRHALPTCAQHWDQALYQSRLART